MQNNASIIEAGIGEMQNKVADCFVLTVLCGKFNDQTIESIYGDNLVMIDLGIVEPSTTFCSKSLYE